MNLLTQINDLIDRRFPCIIDCSLCKYRLKFNDKIVCIIRMNPENTWTSMGNCPDYCKGEMKRWAYSYQASQLLEK
jgi:hypothetical protein